MLVLVLMAGLYWLVLGPAVNLIRTQVDRQEAHESELLHAQVLLEQRVEERTRQLSSTNQALAAALAERARAGVLVRLLVDRGGHVTGEDNAAVGPGEPTVLDALRAEPKGGGIGASAPAFRVGLPKGAVLGDPGGRAGGRR